MCAVSAWSTPSRTTSGSASGVGCPSASAASSRSMRSSRFGDAGCGRTASAGSTRLRCADGTGPRHTSRDHAVAHHCPPSRTTSPTRNDQTRQGFLPALKDRVSTPDHRSTSLILFVASLAVLDAERGAKSATITTFGDALWWAMTTVTTVGYGDRYPITTQGRFIAGGLMLGGIALLGIVTASLASWLLDTNEVRALRAELAARDPAT